MNRRIFFTLAGAVAATPLAAAVPSLAATELKQKTHETESWTSVKDGLPKPGVDVICVKYEMGERYQRIDHVCMHLGSTPFDGQLWFVGDNHRALTTHWRPMLEFPKIV